MADDGAHRSILRAVNNARPGTVITALGEAMTAHFGATKVHVLLANYQLSALRPINADGAPEELDDSAPGQAFTTQEPVVVTNEGRGQAGGQTRERQVYLPVSVGGERIGVLHLALPGALSDGQLGLLQDVATLVGYVLNATSNQSDLLHRAARSQRMTLAAELQWQLLPAHGCLTPQYQLAGHLEPAYACYADSFDWSENEDTLTLSIADAANHARSTPLLTTLAVTASRNARRAGLGISEQACMADQAIYAHHQGAHCVDSIIMSVDITTGQASAVKAGSPDLLLLRNGIQQPVELLDQMPLGMFEGTEYVPQTFELATGDRLLLMSDGVSRALSERSTSHPHEQLREILDTTLDAQPTRVVRAIIDALVGEHQQGGLDDDATVLCLDWTGPGRSSSHTLTTPRLAVRDVPTHLHAVPS